MTSEWAQPSTRTELIENLVSGVDRYNPSNVSILEDYLYHQTRSREYDCLANLAILKLYQFNPELYNPDVVINILIKALTASPSPDFNLCISLLDERPINAVLDEPDPLPTVLPALQNLYELLQGCRFPLFWKTFHGDELSNLRENYTVECVGFEDAIRQVVVRAVEATFTSIGKDRLSTYLDLDDASLGKFVSSQGWSLDQNKKTIVIPVNADTQLESTVVREEISLPQLTKIVSYAAQAA